MLIALIAVTSAIAAAAFVVTAYRRTWRWTGLPADPRGNVRAKTLWDWLQLLIVPLVLAVAAFSLNAMQSTRDQRQEDRRAAHERSIAADRSREDTLHNYIQQMSDLMTRPQSYQSDTQGNVQSLERTLTLIALRRLDGRRKALVVQFLDEAHLITVKSEYGPTQINEDSLPRVALYGADLERADFRGLSFSLFARPENDPPYILAANLDGADLRHARFGGASLWGVSIQDADLRNADFSRTRLTGVSLSQSCLSGARFVDASMQADEDLPGTNLGLTRGVDVDFSGARLDRANFRGATLVGVHLRGATTRGTLWPADWTATGSKRAKHRALCSGEDLSDAARLAPLPPASSIAPSRTP